MAGQAKGPIAGGAGAAAAKLLHQAWETAGVDECRRLFSQLQKVPPAGGDMYKAMLALEKQQPGAQASNDLPPASKRRRTTSSPEALQTQRVRALYEAALAAYGATDHLLWVDFALWQAPTGAGEVYWRATKALDDPQAFVEQYRQQLGV